MWLYSRFLLSYRDVEELLAERGITVSYETIRRWCQKFGQIFADGVRRHRFPGEVISHAVWLYSRFLLRYRDVEELLAERGIAARDETIHRWCRTFGQTVADGARRRRAPSAR